MKKLYKVLATKTIPVVILADDKFDKSPNLEVIQNWISEEENNVDDYEMEIYPMEPNENLKFPFHDWREDCNVYHEGDEEYSLSDARIVASLNEIIHRISSKGAIPMDEAKKNLIDTIQSIME